MRLTLCEALPCETRPDHNPVRTLASLWEVQRSVGEEIEKCELIIYMNYSNN